MWAFFRGWRLKAGCVALAMACLFTTVWLIANQRCFEFVSAVGEPIQIVSARKGFLRWSSYTDINTTAAPFHWQSWPATENKFEPMDAPLMRIEWDWHWDWADFEFGHGRCHGSSRQQVGVWSVPYWFIVWPLILLSAYLILWPGKRKATSKKLADLQLPHDIAIEPERPRR